MEFKEIKSKNNLFEEIWKIYQSAFPPEEKKPKKEVVNLLSNPSYHICAIFNNKLIGFLEFWNFKDFDFIEHMAVAKKFRNKGYGTKILKKFLKRKTVLEIEPPIDEITIRRLNFYNSVGFCKNTFKYVQPPLAKNKKPFPSVIMSYPKKLTEKEFKQVRSTLYKEVYNYENTRH